MKVLVKLDIEDYNLQLPVRPSDVVHSMSKGPYHIVARVHCPRYPKIKHTAFHTALTVILSGAGMRGRAARPYNSHATR